MIILETKDLLEKYGITPNLDVDQHFMIDEKMLKKLVTAAKIKPDEVVFEIGAGIGNLTKLLAKKAKKVYAIEKDGALLGALKQEIIEFQNVEIIIADALKMDFPQFDKLVANLPYQICEALLQKLIFTKFESAIVCVPATFAKIICASDGAKEFSRLSFIVQVFFDAEKIEDVPPESFYPKPKTKSALLQLMPKEPAKVWDYILQELLRQSDKKLKNALRDALIFAGKITCREFTTKRAAKVAVNGMNVSQRMLNKPVSLLCAEELGIVRKKVSNI